MAVSQTIMQRNEGIIRGHLLEQMENSLDVGAKVLDQELRGASILFKPVVHGVYNTIVRGELKTSTNKIINGLIKMCKQMIEEDVEIGSEEFYSRLEKKFPAYLKVDATGKQCKKSHRNFPTLKKNLKNTFEWQLRGVFPLLQVEEAVRDYADLCRNAFEKDELAQTLKKQTDAMKDGIDVIAEDKAILKLPAGKDLFLRVLRKGFEKKVQDFQEEITQFYS